MSAYLCKRLFEIELCALDGYVLYYLRYRYGLHAAKAHGMGHAIMYRSCLLS